MENGGHRNEEKMGAPRLRYAWSDVLFDTCTTVQRQDGIMGILGKDRLAVVRPWRTRTRLSCHPVDVKTVSGQKLGQLEFAKM